MTWHTIDLLAPGAASRLISELQPTHVLHCAWDTTHGKYWTSADNLRWVGASTELIHAFAGTGQRFVMVGTCAEYDWAHGFFSEGITPERPHSLYGTSKLAVHNLLMSTAHQFGFSAATARIFFTYGPHRELRNASSPTPVGCSRPGKRRSSPAERNCAISCMSAIWDVALPPS